MKKFWNVRCEFGWTKLEPFKNKKISKSSAVAVNFEIFFIVVFFIIINITLNSLRNLRVRVNHENFFESWALESRWTKLEHYEIKKSPKFHFSDKSEIVLFNSLIIIQLNNFQKLDKQLDILDTNYVPLLEYFVWRKRNLLSFE